MSTYNFELRICKVCGEVYDAEVLVSSNTFTQSIKSMNEEFRRHSYWICNNCWETNQHKIDKDLKKYLPDKTDFEKQKHAEMIQQESRANQSLRFSGYWGSLSPFMIDTKKYTKFLMEMFDCLSAEIIAQNKPYQLYIDRKEFEPEYICGKQTVGYLFDPTQKGPNISVGYNLATYNGNLHHLFPKIIISAGFSYNFMFHAENLEVSKKICGQGINWTLDVETHKEIHDLKKKSYSWMESDYIANEIEYYQHIYFGTELIKDLIKVFDDYYRVFGKKFEHLREMFLHQHYRLVNEKLEISSDYSSTLEMRLYHEPFTDVKLI